MHYIKYRKSIALGAVFSRSMWILLSFHSFSRVPVKCASYSPHITMSVYGNTWVSSGGKTVHHTSHTPAERPPSTILFTLKFIDWCASYEGYRSQVHRHSFTLDVVCASVSLFFVDSLARLLACSLARSFIYSLSLSHILSTSNAWYTPSVEHCCCTTSEYTHRMCSINMRYWQD